MTALCQQLDEKIAQGKDHIIGYQLCSDLPSIERIYAMRKKAVGLLGNAKGAAKPIPFVEDTCVPPEHLADYIAEFRALLDSHNLQYGMFGHVDAGVLHVRPALDLCDKDQVKLFKLISDEVAELTVNTAVCYGVNTVKVYVLIMARNSLHLNFGKNYVM